MCLWGDVEMFIFFVVPFRWRHFSGDTLYLSIISYFQSLWLLYIGLWLQGSIRIDRRADDFSSR